MPNNQIFDMIEQAETLDRSKFHNDEFRELISMLKQESSQSQKQILLDNIMETIVQCLNPKPKDQKEQSNFCHRSIIQGETYYQCHSCAPVDTDDFKFAAVYCSECFEACRHSSHFWIQAQASEEVYMFCSCGCSQSMRREGFCKLHNDQRVIEAITNSHEDEIIQSLKQIISIQNLPHGGNQMQDNSEGNELKENSYIKCLVHKLIDINQDSITANRITARWLSLELQSTTEIKYSQLSYLQLLAGYVDIRCLVRQVCKDKTSKKIIIKTIDQMENLPRNRSFPTHDYIIFDLTTLEELAYQDNFYMGPKLHIHYESKAHFSLQTKNRCSPSWFQDRAMRLHGRQCIYWFLNGMACFLSKLVPVCEKAQEMSDTSNKLHLVHQVKQICSLLLVCSDLQIKKQCMNYISRYYKSLNEFEQSYLTSELAEVLLFLLLACYPCVDEIRKEMDLPECQSSKSQQGVGYQQLDQQNKTPESSSEPSEGSEMRMESGLEQSENSELCSWIHLMCAHSALDESFDSLPEYFIETCKIMLRLLAIASAANFKLLHHDKYIQSRICRYSKSSQLVELLTQKFLSFSHWMSLYSYSICFVDEAQNKKELLVFIVAALSHCDSYMRKLIDRMWKAVFDRAETRVYSAVDYSMHILRLVLRADLNLHSFHNMLSMKHCTCMFDTDAQNSPDKSVQSQVYLEKWFKQLLKNRRKISKTSLADLKQKGYLQFGRFYSVSSPEEILKQWCYYNEEEQEFYLKLNLLKPDGVSAYVLEFPTPSDCFDYKVYYQCQSSCNYQQEQGATSCSQLLGQVSKALLTRFLQSSVVLEQLNLFWKISNDLITKLRNNEELDEFEQNSDEKTEMCGYLFLFALVQLDKFISLIKFVSTELLEVWHMRLRQQLKHFSQHPERFAPFAHKEGELQKIQKLFSIVHSANIVVLSQPNQLNETTADGEQVQANKLKYKSKKEKINEKFKASRKLMLQQLTLMPQCLEKQTASEEICLICHEKQTVDNELVYLAHVKKGRTISTIFLGAANNAAQILIDSCFHPIHLSCYLNMGPPQSAKQSSQVDEVSYKFVHLRCPLCSKPTNIVFSKGPSKIEQTCYNLLNVSFVLNFKVYEPVNVLFFYWAHLVESLGLNALVSPNLNLLKWQLTCEEDPTWTKMDAMAMQKLKQRIMANNPYQISQFRNLLRDMEIDINSSSNDGCRLVQSSVFHALLFATAEFSELPLLYPQHQCMEILIDQLLKLRALVEEEEFSVILSNVIKATRRLDLGQRINNHLIQSLQIGQKVSLKFKLTPLPKCSKEALLMFGTKKCVDCQQTIFNRVEEQEQMGEEAKKCNNILCLLCGETICFRCAMVEQDKTHWIKSHFGAYFGLELSTLKLIHASNGSQEHRSIYYNSLMVSYAEKQKYAAMKCDAFTMNEAKLQCLAAEFINSL